MRGGQPPAGAARDAGGDARWLGRPTLMRAEEGRDLSGAFLIEKRADDIDQRAARLDQRASDLEQVRLKRRPPVAPLGGEAPARFQVAAPRAGARAARKSVV